LSHLPKIPRPPAGTHFSPPTGTPPDRRGRFISASFVSVVSAATSFCINCREAGKADEATLPLNSTS
jgi:hypothetical protein